MIQLLSRNILLRTIQNEMSLVNRLGPMLYFVFDIETSNLQSKPNDWFLYELQQWIEKPVYNDHLGDEVYMVTIDR